MTETAGESGIAEGCLIYHDMPFLEYCQLPGLSASALKGHGRHSPKHLDAYLNHQMPRQDTEDMKFGRAAHCMILEPERFDEDFPIATRCGAVLTSGERKGEQCTNQGIKRNAVGNWFCGTHGKTLPDAGEFISEEESARLKRLGESLKHSTANEYLRRPGFHECVIQWQQFGMTLKTRIDKLSVADLITIVDFKKCQVGKAQQEAAQKTCLDMNYHVQIWFQIAGVQAAYGADREIDANFLFIEDSDPFDTYLLPTDMQQDLVIADRFVVSHLTDYVRCKKAGVFHGCQRMIDPGKRGMLPPWHVKKMLAGE